MQWQEISPATLSKAVLIHISYGISLIRACRRNDNGWSVYCSFNHPNLKIFAYFASWLFIPFFNEMELNRVLCTLSHHLKNQNKPTYEI